MGFSISRMSVWTAWTGLDRIDWFWVVLGAPIQFLVPKLIIWFWSGTGPSFFLVRNRTFLLISFCFFHIAAPIHPTCSFCLLLLSLFYFLSFPAKIHQFNLHRLLAPSLNLWVCQIMEENPLNPPPFFERTPTIMAPSSLNFLHKFWTKFRIATWINNSSDPKFLAKICESTSSIGLP